MFTILIFKNQVAFKVIFMSLLYWGMHKKNQPKIAQLLKITQFLANCLLKIQQSIYKYFKRRNYTFWGNISLLVKFSEKHKALFKALNSILHILLKD